MSIYVTLLHKHRNTHTHGNKDKYEKRSQVYRKQRCDYYAYALFTCLLHAAAIDVVSSQEKCFKCVLLYH